MMIKQDILLILKIKFYIKKLDIGQGFTLIELLVTVMIIGVLAIVATPNLWNQIGKARETEAKTNLSSIGQSQQVYFLEKSTFADLISKLDVNVSLGGFYNYPDPVSANSSLVKHLATNPTAVNQGTRNYGLGVYFVTGDFGIILCQSNEVGSTVEAPNTYTDICIGGEEVR